jgi:hypothetical protein
MKKGILIRRIKSSTVIAFTLAWLSTSVYADDNTFDARSLAMGGTGVTTSTASNAAFHNPSMLASTSKDSFAIELPIISVRLQDENKLHSNISTLKSDGNALQSSIQAFQGGGPSQEQANAGPVASSLDSFNNALALTGNKSLVGDIFVGTVLGIPSQKAAISVFVDERATAGAQLNYVSADQTNLSNLSSQLSICSSTGNCSGANTALAADSTNGKLNPNFLQSELLVRGVVFKDVGIAAAHHFDFLQGIDLGITPKFSQVTTYDYAVSSQSSNISLNQGEKRYSAFNMDFGATKDFKTDGGNEVKAGMVVKNLVSHSFVTVLGNSIDVKPQATIGASYVTKLTTTGIDLDVIKNSPLLSDFSKDSQYLRVGAEFDAWRWVQLRVGYRYDIKGNYPGLPSVGLGLSPFGIHIELSAAYANSKEAALSLQTGFRF